MKQFIEKYSIQIQIGTLIAVTFFIIGGAYQFAKVESGYTNSIENIKSQNVDSEMAIEQLQDRQSQTDLNMMEIKTKLAAIEASLIEIKNKLK